MHVYDKTRLNSFHIRIRTIAGHKLFRQLAPLLVVGCVIALFARTFDFGLYLDDNHHARPWTLNEVLGTFVGPFDPLGIEPPYFRPLVVVTFAIDWSIWGWNAWGYHLTNVLLHAAASVLVYVFLCRLKLNPLAALLGALCFAVLPADAATAIYISERSDAMVVIFTLCGLLSLDTYCHTHKGVWLAALNIMVGLAVCSKEIGVVLPFLAIGYWIYCTWLDIPLTQQHAIRSTHIFGRGAAGMRQLWLSAVGDGRWKHLVLVAVPPLALIVFYLVYRSVVLPTGLVSASYSHSKGPVRGLISAVWWTFKAAPWEVPARALPFFGVAAGLALALHRRSKHWRVVLVGVAWVVISCLPLAYLGQVEPRLLYLPEVGYSVVVAGLMAVLGEWLSLSVRYTGLRRWGAMLLVSIVTLSFTATTLDGQLRAQNEFQPFGYKMLHADDEIYHDARHRQLYPPYRIQQIEQILRQAQRLP